METSVNNKCRAFTSLEQSRKLAEILPLESADMEFMFLKKDNSMVSKVPFVKDGFEEPECCYLFIPCWSLAALLDVLPGTRLLKSANISSVGDTKYHCDYPKGTIHEWYDNPVDACYEMVMRLNELKML